MSEDLELIQKLINEYSLEYLKDFFRKKSDYFSVIDKKYFLHSKNIEYFGDISFIGKIEPQNNNNHKFCVFAIETKKQFSERSGKRAQFELARKILNELIEYTGGFFVFSDSTGNFRLSFVFSDFKLLNNRVVIEFSNYRRYTYFVSKDQPNHTFIKQVSVANFNSFESIRDAFSVEKITEEFYNEIQNWYFWALDNVKFPDYAEANDNGRNIAVIRLITRLIFVWFMREKGLIPKELFEENIFKYLNTTDKTASSYYKAVLQNLFFATLNTKMRKDDKKSRQFVEDAKRFGYINDGHLQQGYFRYSRFIKKELKDEFLKLFEDIPFINGGLFDCLDKSDTERIDCFSDKEKNEELLKVPDKLFFAKNEIEVNLGAYFSKNKIRKVRGLLEILKQYNFTIDENTPVDQEIALDPELLGRIFENLLASYNEETKTTARKSSGSFYTPREIVNYTVDESLIAYLKSKLLEANPQIKSYTGMSDQSESEENIENELRNLLSYNDEPHNFSQDEIEIIISAIDNLKILDPACGSGAFPMGILHKLVHILHKLDPKNEIWINKILERTPIEVREETEKALLNKSLDYVRKLGLIESCIYGVDKQSIATQISKLRFFISLIIDQDIDDSKENRGIQPLPNLEIKFITADTLIGLKKDNRILSSEAIDTERKLHLKRKEIFFTNSLSKKKKLQAEEKQAREELKQKLADCGFESEQAKQIASWDPFDQNSSADWFDPEWMFGVTDGFDIVIGNPPYIQLQKAADTKKKFADFYKDQKYETFDRTGDIYCLFYEKGLQLLKPGGHLCYITSNKWMRAGYGEKLRKLFTRYNPLLLIDLGPGVFENATVDTNILIIQKSKSTTSIPAGANQQSTSSILAGANQQSTTSIPAGEIYEFFNPYNEIEIYRGNLPHWQQKNVWYFITFRLADSIPEHAKEKIKTEREIWLKKHKDKDLSLLSKEEKIEYYRLFTKRIEELLDSGYGECILKESKISKIVADALLHFNNERYILDEWVIMPNHVHVLVKPLGNYSITDILHSWKSYTANEINKLLGRKGQVWMHESYDHIVRNEKAFEAIRQYIRNNPKGKSTPSILAGAGGGSFQNKGKSITSIPAGEGESSFQSRDALGTLGSFQSRDALGTLRLRAVTLQKEDKANIAAVVKEKGVVLTKLSGDAWFIGSDAEQRLKEKIERIGKPLKEWDVKIYRGVLTGLNEAFIITTEKRNEILANCSVADASCIGGLNERQRTEAIIKPILRGRDIKRYYYEWAGLWVIFIPWHFPLHEDLSIQGSSEKAEKEFQKQYPTVYQHLLQFKDSLSKRNKEETGIRYEWYALQRCAATYYPEFEKEKVVWASVGETYYCWVDKNHLVLDTNYFTTSLQKWQLGVLNSKFIINYINGLDTLVGNIAYRHYKYNFEKIPIPPITPTNEPIVKQIEALVDKILEAKQSTSSILAGESRSKDASDTLKSSIPAGATTTSRSRDASATLELEREIDELVYRLYDLTEEEVRIIEEKP